MNLRPLRGEDQGETLVEILVAIAVLGTAGIAVLGSVMLGIKISDIHRKTTGAAAVARNYVEAIENYIANTPGATGVSGGYAPCAAANYYSSKVASSVSLPASWNGTITESRAVAVAATGSATTGCVTSPATDPAYDGGVQQITLTATSNDGHGSESLTVILRKPCSYRWSDPSPATNGACS